MIKLRDVAFKVGEEYAQAVDVLVELGFEVSHGKSFVEALTGNYKEILEAVNGYQEALEAIKGEYANEARAYLALKIDLKKK